MTFPASSLLIYRDVNRFFVRPLLPFSLFLALSVPAIAQPAKMPSKPVAKKAPSVFVDPKAVPIFARAIQLYSPLNALRMEFTVTTRDSTSDVLTTRNSFAWERRGRLRNKVSSLQTMVIIDGKRKFSVEEELGEEGEAPEITYEVEPVTDAAAESLEGISGSFPMAFPGQILVNFLSGVNDLLPQKVAETVAQDGFLGLRVVVLPTQPFKGQACNLVRVTWSEKARIFGGVHTEQETLWFSRKDGRIIRDQWRSTGGKELDETNDVQYTRQELNPKFSASYFSYVPPKGAVRRKPEF